MSLSDTKADVVEEIIEHRGFGEDAELAFLLVDVHANMVHGWPLLLRR